LRGAKSALNRSRFRAVGGAVISYDSTTGRDAKGLPGPKAPAIQEVVVKELSLEEVLRIAGGVPVTAALDELTYRAPQDPAGEPLDYARLLGLGLRPAEPT
jgi:hypothetical protein